MRQAQRRQFLVAAAAAVMSGCCPPGAGAAVGRAASVTFDDVERKLGGRVGVCVLDTASGKQLRHRAGDRFAMCSTFKWVLAAAIVRLVDRGELSLGTRVPYSAADLLEYAPVTREHVDRGFLSVETLARAVVVVSDNAAANLLLPRVGGPAGLTRFCREMGDHTTRLDRFEPLLNSNEPGDVRDTTSPTAMVGLMRELLLGSRLSYASRTLLLSWLRASTTGKTRLRAGFPADWVVGDKTGNGPRNSINDLAIASPPGRKPLLIAVYMSGGTASTAAYEAAYAEIARTIATTFRG